MKASHKPHEVNVKIKMIAAGAAFAADASLSSAPASAMTVEIVGYEYVIK
ncbi:hypothetical protein [Corynebacterium diphtheriae]|nr:hypothetical protein [Corynebacterium diphtheriae]